MSKAQTTKPSKRTFKPKTAEQIAEENAKSLAELNTAIVERLKTAITTKWESQHTGRKYLIPTNIFTGRPYTGQNSISLMLLNWGGSNGFATYKQVDNYAKQQKELGVPQEELPHVMKGAKSFRIIMKNDVQYTRNNDELEDSSKQAPTKDETPEEKPTTEADAKLAPTTFVKSFFREYSVFSAEQIQNAPFMSTPINQDLDNNNQAIEDIINAMLSTGLKIVHGVGNHYVIGKDEVHMHLKSAFVSDQAYAATLIHEFIHAQIHPSRCNIDLGVITDEVRSKEEVTAEIGSVYMLTLLGLKPTEEMFENSMSYVSGWAKHSGTPSTIFKDAMADAAKRCNKIIEITHQYLLKVAPERANQFNLLNLEDHNAPALTSPEPTFAPLNTLTPVSESATPAKAIELAPPAQTTPEPTPTRDSTRSPGIEKPEVASTDTSVESVEEKTSTPSSEKSRPSRKATRQFSLSM